MEKTYWAMAGMLFKKGGEGWFSKRENEFPEPAIIPAFEPDIEAFRH
jgi:hypothetical protein